MSAFNIRSRFSNFGGGSNDESSNGLPPVGGTTDIEQISVSDEDQPLDANEKLLIIPISQEIAPDFSLIGYERIIRVIEEVMTQAAKRRNVMLYGNNGVGKSAITQGLVQRKNRRDLSANMYKRTFYRLNTSRLLHNDDVREINKRFEQVITEFSQYDVLVIENFYTFQSYLKVKGANAVIIAFIEALARKKFQSIITCSTREKPLLISEVPEVHEYFSPESIPEPNGEELLNILRGVHQSYEKRYGVAIPDDVLCTIRDLTQKWRNGLEEWAQPGRAFILLDRAIAQFSVRMNSKPPELSKFEYELNNAKNELKSLCHNNGKAYKSEDQKRISDLSSRIASIEPDVNKMQAEWEEATAPIRTLQLERVKFEKKLHSCTNQRLAAFNLRENNTALTSQNKTIAEVDLDIQRLNEMIRLNSDEITKINKKLAQFNLSDRREHEITVDNIAETFSELTGISVKQLNQDDRQRVLKMEEILGERVYGQAEAISLVSNAVRRAKANLSDNENTPKGSFLFLGPSGVGKTELGKSLAEFETGSEKNLVRIDMSEFMEKHSISRLIGAPPGYAGYEEGGVLTNAVLSRPKSVVMFDEIEKAHEDVFKILLQILGDGRLTDGKGVTVDFSETYIVLTSNVGTPYFVNQDVPYDVAVEEAKKLVQKFLLPEIRGRLDSIVCFRRLELPLLKKVAVRRYAALNKSISRNGFKLVIDDNDTDLFCQKYGDVSFGARAILNNLKITLEKELAIAILAMDSSIPGTFTSKFVDTTFAPMTFTAD